LQIGTDFLLIVTRTAAELSGGTNINDLEIKNSGFLVIFFCDFRL